MHLSAMVYESSPKECGNLDQAFAGAVVVASISILIFLPCQFVYPPAPPPYYKAYCRQQMDLYCAEVTIVCKSRIQQSQRPIRLL